MPPIMVYCPCCDRPWRMAPHQRLPIFALKGMAFRYVEERTGVTRSELQSSRRRAELIEARALIVWIAKTFGPWSDGYCAIGRWLDKDHSSIIHYWREVVPRLREHNADFVELCGGFHDFAAQSMEPLQ